MKTCLNCGQENGTNRLVCAKCAARTPTPSAPVQPVNGSKRQAGLSHAHVTTLSERHLGCARSAPTHVGGYTFSANRAGGEMSKLRSIIRWLRRVMHFLPAQPMNNPAPVRPGHRGPATGSGAGEMDQLRAWFRQHKPKTRGI